MTLYDLGGPIYFWVLVSLLGSCTSAAAHPGTVLLFLAVVAVMVGAMALLDRGLGR